MKFAVIGTDIAGMVAAYLLSRRHQVVVFKQDTPLSPNREAIRSIESRPDESADKSMLRTGPRILARPCEGSRFSITSGDG